MSPLWGQQLKVAQIGIFDKVDKNHSEGGFLGAKKGLNSPPGVKNGKLSDFHEILTVLWNLSTRHFL